MRLNYSGNKKRKEEARRKKQEEKRQRRLNKSGYHQAPAEMEMPRPDQVPPIAL